MKTLLKRTLAGLAISAAMITGAQAALLSTLLAPTGSITVGDKLFDNWSRTYVSSDGTRNFDADNIEVIGIDDGGDYGLRFAVGNGELSVIGDGIYAFVDLTLSFRVSVLPGAGMLIKDNSLTLTQGQVTNSGDNGFFIHETIGTAPGLGDLGDKDVEFSFLEFDENGDPGPGLISILNDSAEFAPQSEIWVTKNIIVWATETNETADLFGFTQRFSQQAVPEPGSLALVALALTLAGLGFMRRRAG